MDKVMFKHDYLSCDPQHPFEKPSMVTHVCKPRTRYLEIEGSMVLVGNDSRPIFELYIQ